jgi:hypothetical protein
MALYQKNKKTMKPIKLKGLLNENKTPIQKEALDDLDVNLPTAVNRFLEKLTAQLKTYNLPRKKEVLVIAKIIDGLNMDKQEVMRAIQKIKQADALGGQKKNDAGVVTESVSDKIKMNNKKYKSLKNFIERKILYFNDEDKALALIDSLLDDAGDNGASHTKMNNKKYKDLKKIIEKKILYFKDQDRVMNVFDSLLDDAENEGAKIRGNKEKNISEKAPEGWEGTVKAMKDEPEIDNPYALTNWMKNKGYQSHKEHKLNELNFFNQRAFDIYTRQHKLRPDTEVKIAGKTMTAAQASKKSSADASKKTNQLAKMPAIKTVRDGGFTDKELKFLIPLINSFSTGGHPMPDDSNIKSFTIPFIKQLMKKAKTKVPDKYKSEYDSVASKLK